MSRLVEIERLKPRLTTREEPAVAGQFGNAVTRDQILFPEDYPELDGKPGRPQPLEKAS